MITLVESKSRLPGLVRHHIVEDGVTVASITQNNPGAQHVIQDQGFDTPEQAFDAFARANGYTLEESS